jgi:hypothetical protein
MSNNGLFSSMDRPWYKAIIGNENSPATNWEKYASGYKRGAESLVAQIIEEPVAQDLLIFPIVFLYRHYLELRIKDLIFRGSQFLSQDLKIPKHHDLRVLWVIAEQVVSQIWPDDDLKSLRVIRQVLTDFGNVDKISDAFRYPVDTEGAANLPGLQLINIVGFARTVTKAVDILEAIAFGIAAFQDRKDETERSYRSLFPERDEN